MVIARWRRTACNDRGQAAANSSDGVDPYGSNPVVMTGSHNLEPKASGVNDENLVIVKRNGDLASQYAGKIMRSIPNTGGGSRFSVKMASRSGEALPTTTTGRSSRRLRPCDKRRLRELEFSFGSDLEA